MQLSLALLTASIGCILLLIARMRITGSQRYTFLVWNLLLAWIPYTFSCVMSWMFHKIHSKSKLQVFIIVTGFFWLLFYPNAPYILTDFIHLIRLPNYIPNSNSSLLTANSIMWYDIILHSSFAFIGHIIGLISLVIVHRLFSNIFKRYIGWSIAVIAILLSGYGIYLGRFIRLNSWNIFTHPLVSIQIIFLNLFNLKAILFTLCFAFFIFLTYIIVYSFYKFKLQQCDNNTDESNKK